MNRTVFKLFAVAFLVALTWMTPATSEAIDPYCSCERCTVYVAAWPVCLNRITGQYTRCEQFAADYCYLIEPPPPVDDPGGN